MTTLLPLAAIVTVLLLAHACSRAAGVAVPTICAACVPEEEQPVRPALMWLPLVGG